MLKQDGGATLAEIVAATGWQKHRIENRNGHEPRFSHFGARVLAATAFMVPSLSEPQPAQ